MSDPAIIIARLCAEAFARRAAERRERVARMAQSPERVIQERIAADIAELAADMAAIGAELARETKTGARDGR